MVKKDNPNPKSTDMIVFLVLRISKDPIEAPSKIELVSKSKTEGKLKAHNTLESHFADYLTLEIFEANKLVQTIQIEHPLFKQIEYLDESNQLASKQLKLKNEEFFIRFQVKDGLSTKVKIQETLKNQPKKELQIFKL